MSRRAVPFIMLLLLALSGCTRAGDRTVAAPAPTTSPSTAAPSTEPTTLAPPMTPAPPTTPTTPTTPTSPSTSDCAGPAVAVNRPRATVIGPQGSHKTTGTMAVALTFDDGPDPVNTPRILDVLRQCGIKATFCVLGYRVAMYPDVIRRIVAEGHSLCNHSWKHIMQLGTYGPNLIREDLQQTLDAIHAVVPDAPVSYFRAPGGFWSADYVTVARQLGMIPLDWDVDPRDWDFDSYGTGAGMTAHIVSTIEGTVRPGSVVLSHDYQKPATTAAYVILLPWLASRFTLIALPPLRTGSGRRPGPQVTNLL